MKTFLNSYKQIIKTDLLSAHMVAGKIIFQKAFKNKKHNEKDRYLEKFLLERGKIQDFSNNDDFMLKKVEEIKTPQIRKKLNVLINEMKLSKSSSFQLMENNESEKKNEIYKKNRNSKIKN